MTYNGKYTLQFNISEESSQSGYMMLEYDAHISVNLVMVWSVILFYLNFIILLIHALVTSNFTYLLEVLNGAQLMHLLALGPVNLTPSLVWFAQRISVFNFVEPFLQEYAYESFSKVKQDSIYNAGYSTSNIFPNQILSFVVWLFLISCKIICYGKFCVFNIIFRKVLFSLKQWG